MESPADSPRKTKPKGHHPDKALSAAFCRTVARSGRYCDGNGLYLHGDWRSTAAVARPFRSWRGESG